MDAKPASSLARIVSCVEAALVFTVVVGSFALVDHLPLDAWQQAAFGRRGVLPYAASGLALLVLSAVRGPSLQTYGVSLRHLRADLQLVGKGFFPMLLLGVALSWLDWRTWPGAIAVTLIEGGLMIWLVRALRPCATGASEAPVVAACLAVGAFGVRTSLSGRAPAPLQDVALAYLLIAPVEELLFRGYILSRLNLAFGRPYRLGGIAVGWGLVISAALFGLWHVVNPLSPGVWPHGLWTLGAGLLLGLLRERGESLVAPSLLHGIMNYGPQALLYTLFFAQ